MDALQAKGPADSKTETNLYAEARPNAAWDSSVCRVRQQSKTIDISEKLIAAAKYILCLCKVMEN